MSTPAGVDADEGGGECGLSYKAEVSSIRCVVVQVAMLETTGFGPSVCCVAGGYARKGSGGPL